MEEAGNLLLDAFLSFSFSFFLGKEGKEPGHGESGFSIANEMSVEAESVRELCWGELQNSYRYRELLYIILGRWSGVGGETSSGKGKKGGMDLRKDEESLEKVKKKKGKKRERSSEGLYDVTFGKEHQSHTRSVVITGLSFCSSHSSRSWVTPWAFWLVAPKGKPI